MTEVTKDMLEPDKGSDWKSHFKATPSERDFAKKYGISVDNPTAVDTYAVINQVRAKNEHVTPVGTIDPATRKFTPIEPRPVPAEEVKPAKEEPTKAEKVFAADLNKKVSGLRQQIKELEKETAAPAAYYQDSAKNASERLKRTDRINRLSDLRAELHEIEQAHKYDLAENLTATVPEEGKNFEGRMSAPRSNLSKKRGSGN